MGTNLEKWKFYESNLPSPESWITLGWPYVVSSALQRRAFIGRSIKDRPLFPNLYIIFCGPPATGKSLVMSDVKDILKHHKLPAASQEERIRRLAREGVEPQLIATGPNDITYEALTGALSRSIRTIPYKDEYGERAYVHCSMAFILSELKSLFKRKGDDKVPTLNLLS